MSMRRRSVFSGGFPVAHDPKSGKMWLIIATGWLAPAAMLRPDSGGGTELYIVIGHALRHLDRNVTRWGEWC